jgi:DNA (cytosine-5)-methyltransferase 1
LTLSTGTPPCAAWSVAGYTKTKGTDKWKTDPRVNCTRQHFGLLANYRPKVWVWESVTQAFTKGREFCDALAQEAISLGYSVTYLLHDSRWLGLPQVRKRFFMVCHRVEFTPTKPDFTKTYTPSEFLSRVRDRGGRDDQPYVSSRAVDLTLLKEVRPGERLSKFWERHCMKGIPPGEWERNASGGCVGRPPFGIVRLPTDGPCGAIVGYGMIHPTEDRYLSTRELQVLSGFPQDYQFTPNGANARASEIARGVCPPVGEWLARAVASAISRGKEVETPTLTLIDYRQPPGYSMPLTIGGPPTGGTSPQEEGGGDVVPWTPPKPRESTAVRPVAPGFSGGNDGKGRRGPVARPQGIGEYIRQLLVEGRYTTEQIVAAVRHKFPQSRATAADVAWNRTKLSKLRQEAGNAAG